MADGAYCQCLTATAYSVEPKGKLLGFFSFQSRCFILPLVFTDDHFKVYTMDLKEHSAFRMSTVHPELLCISFSWPSLFGFVLFLSWG